MTSIQESVQKHQELISEGKGTPVRSVPESSPILPEPASIGQLGPSRGSFVPGQVLDTDIAKQNIIGTPERSRMFPIPSNNGNNNAGIQQALKSIVKASEASVAQTVASFKNTPVATTDPSTGSLTQTTIGQSTPLPFAPPERRIPLDNIADGVLRVGLATTHASNNVAYNFKGAWSNVANYVIGDEATFDNIYWIALVANFNSQPSVSNANWQAVGRIQGDLQIFTASGTWNKPAAGTFAVITCVGAGGGGGGGKSTTGSPSAGGGGGGGGGYSRTTIPLSVLGTTESVVAGGGGTGGASNTNGSDGSNASFGNWIVAFGGLGGISGNSTGAGGSGGAGTTGTGGNGGAGGTGTGAVGANPTGMAAGGGAAGGGSINTTPFVHNGGVGGMGSPFRNVVLAGGTAGTGIPSGASTSGGSGSSSDTDEVIGGAGGGGGGSQDTSGGVGNGGNGGNYGGGGGGGGAYENSTNAAGAGGNGAPGIVVIAVY